MIELDLIGHRISLTDSDARLLLAAAEADSGSSIGSRDLATRLKETFNPSMQRRRRLVFSRPETRALQRIFQTHLKPGEPLSELQITLTKVLGGDEPAPMQAQM